MTHFSSPGDVTDAGHNRVVALLPWGNVIEDFLESINLTLDKFCQDMTGGWLFGYIEALKTVGVKTVIVCVSSETTVPVRRLHTLTGAVIWVLPAPGIYLRIRDRMAKPYGGTVKSTFGKKAGINYPWLFSIKEIAPHVSTPPKSLIKVLKEENCQAILCQEYEYARFDVCIAVGKLLNIPVYASFQGGDFQLTKIENLWRRWSIRASAGLIVATQGEISRLKRVYGVPRTNIAQVFNPLDTSVWRGGDLASTRLELGISEDAHVVVWHGRIDLHRKGLDILMAAWQQICTHQPDRKDYLLLVGTGSDASTLRQRIEAMQLPRILWIDEYILDRQRIRNYLKAADVYVLPSRHEGFPVAPLEAMACGLPIVATEVPGIPDILENHEHSGGIRVPREDPAQLATALTRLLESDRLRDRIGRAASQRIEYEFSLVSVGQKLREFMFPSGDACE